MKWRGLEDKPDAEAGVPLGTRLLSASLALGTVAISVGALAADED